MLQEEARSGEAVQTGSPEHPPSLRVQGWEELPMQKKVVCKAQDLENARHKRKR